jgi:hypothetical protein
MSNPKLYIITNYKNYIKICFYIIIEKDIMLQNVPEFPDLYRNRDASNEKEVENPIKGVLERPLLSSKELISNEDNRRDCLFHFSKVTLILFGIISICLIIVYILYTYYYHESM